MHKGSFASTKINLKIAYGFVIVSILVLLIGAFSFYQLVDVRKSFEKLDENISEQIISLEKIRSIYSQTLLEMTTLLILDLEGEEQDRQVALIKGLEDQLAASISEFDQYLSDQAMGDFMGGLHQAEIKSVDLINQIVDLEVGDGSKKEILALKAQLKETEGEDFFPLLDSMLAENQKSIATERQRVADASAKTIAILIVLVSASFFISALIGFLISRREKVVDQFRDQLVSVAAHQLKAPITVIKGNAEILGDELELPDKYAENITDIREASNNLLTSVNNFLDLSRIDQGRFILEPKEISLMKLMTGVIESLKPIAEKKKIKINFKEALDVMLKADEFRISQVFTNLIENSMKYGPANGSIEVAAAETDKTVKVSIQDSGIGIPEKEQKNIFKRFYRAANAKEKDSTGTGLGLFVVKAIVEDSGGKIWFKSKKDQGTTFFVELPRGSFTKKKKEIKKETVKKEGEK